ncbi:YoaK family protein [Fusobacterium sp. PH5-44]|uniref:YoaK family protein n=1 Tax=unclassified Fusobacterium TaxID=2648384 RepID=UPI003D200055
MEKFLLFWIYSLTFTSGMLNSIAVIFFSITVSHFTGTISNLAHAIANLNFNLAFTFLGLIFLFFLGSFISGFFTNERNFNLQKRYGGILILIGLTLIILTFIFSSATRGLVLSLPLILGVQNGLMLGYKGVIVRTTHMSGNITDFGAYMGHYLRGNKDDLRKALYSFWNIIFFILGGIVGTLSYSKFRYNFFNIIGVFYIFLGTFYFFIRTKFHKKS